VVEDASDSSANGYVTFDLRNQSSNTDGFSTSELDKVNTVYKARNKMITDLKSSYSRLRTNSTWIDKSDTFYDNMKDVIDNVSSKEFSNYGEYLDAFKSRYNYTIDNR